jgi:pyruvate,water dikinase
MGRYVKLFGEMSKKDFQEAGGKGANLGELTLAGFPVPPGFCVCSGALSYVLEANALQPQIDAIVSRFDYDDFEGVEKETDAIRSLVESGQIPDDLASELRNTIAQLIGPEQAFVAVRSSVAVKGTSLSSFPGMMDTYHFIKGEEAIIHHIRMCWASLWTSRAVYNRHHKKIGHDLGLIAPLVQRMVNPDVAGVLFTANPITGDTGEIVIEANWGLGESVVSGKSMNDFFLLDKASLATETRRIVRKTVMVTFDREQGFGRKEYAVPPDRVSAQTLSDAQVRELGEAGKKIEALFGSPQDVEWAFENGDLYILQSRKVKNLKVQGP